LRRSTAVIYIFHRLPEVKRVADRITILRDGQVRGTFEVTGISEQKILRLIIGRSVERAFPEKGRPNHEAAPLLTARKLANGMLQRVDLSVLPGEVVGLAGVEGNGQRDCLRALAGLVPVSGMMAIRQKPVRLSDPIEA
jgi:ribose transport system ATP-binding protein